MRRNAKNHLFGSLNTRFPNTLSVLAIPLESDPLGQLLLNGWDNFEDVESLEMLKGIVKTLIKNNNLPSIEKWKVTDIWNAIEERKKIFRQAKRSFLKTTSRSLNERF